MTDRVPAVHLLAADGIHVPPDEVIALDTAVALVRALAESLRGVEGVDGLDGEDMSLRFLADPSA